MQHDANGDNQPGPRPPSSQTTAKKPFIRAFYRGPTVLQLAMSRRLALSFAAITVMVSVALRTPGSPSLVRVASRTIATPAPLARARLCRIVDFFIREPESPAPLHRGARRMPAVAVTRIALPFAAIATMVSAALGTPGSPSLVRMASRPGPTSAPRARESLRRRVTFSWELESPTPLR